jgi:hypothetical protein
MNKARVASCDTLLQTGGINSLREGARHLRLWIVQGEREHSIMLWFVVNCDLHGEIVVYLPCIYSSETYHFEFKSNWYTWFNPEASKLSWMLESFLLGRLLSVPFVWFNMLFLEFCNWFYGALNSVSSKYQRKFAMKIFVWTLSNII